MSEVYSTPVHDSPESQEVSVDTLAQEEIDGMQSRLSALADAGTVPSKIVATFVEALPGLPDDEDVLGCSVASLGNLARHKSKNASNIGECMSRSRSCKVCQIVFLPRSRSLY